MNTKVPQINALIPQCVFSHKQFLLQCKLRFFLQEYISRLSQNKSRTSCKNLCLNPSIWPAIILSQQRCHYFCLQKYGTILISSLEQYLLSKSWNQLEFITTHFLLCQWHTSTLCRSGARSANITESPEKMCQYKLQNINNTNESNMSLNPKTIFAPSATKF